MSEQARDWVSFWDSAHSIYVNARHLDAHYRDIATAIIRLLPRPDARVLDYGCGEAIHAGMIAGKAARLLLCDASESVRTNLASRFAGERKITVLAPEEAEQLEDASFDLIVTNSVAQYLSSTELDRLLANWRRLLSPGGVLVVGDVIPSHVGPLQDAASLLRYAAARGFLLPAIAGLIRTAVSPYRKLRNALGVSLYSEAQFLQKLTAAGFSAERLQRNLEHNQMRMSFRARPAEH
jgi:ubiquinone/menaquinone biosynthesis C-methylase UbiE